MPVRVSAAPRPGATARADSTTHPPKPFLVMLRSAAVPGWGQATNREYLKAVGVASVEGYLAYRALHAWRQELDATDRANATTNEVDFERYLADRDRHANTKINFIWWSMAAHALNMVDAYVAANLTTFDADFGPPDAGVSLENGPRLTLALRVRF